MEDHMDILSRLSPSDPHPVIAAVGSGGKTSCLTLLAHQCRLAGRSVFLTTSTHMRRTDDVCCSISLPVLSRHLADTGFLFAGSPAPEGKIGPLPEAAYLHLSQLAQITLVEADGSRGLPLKMPAYWEPVLPEKTDLVLVLLGLSALGQPLEQVCHRWERAIPCLGCERGELVTPQMAARLLEAGYLEPLRDRGLPFLVVLNQADQVSPGLARQLERLLSPAPVLITSLAQVQADNSLS